MTEVREILRAAEQRTSPPYSFDVDTAVHRAQQRLRRLRVVQAGAVGAAAAMAVVATMAWPSDTSSAPPASDLDKPVPEVLEPHEVVDHYELFAELQTQEDKAPREVLKNSDIVKPSTTRLLGSFEGTRYWAARAKSGGVCVVTGGEHWNASCSGPGVLANEPTITAGAVGVTAQLLPDSYEPSIEEHAGWVFVGSNLAVSDSMTASATKADEAWIEALTDASTYFASLGQPQRPEDIVTGIGEESTLPPWSSRYLGGHHGTRYWLGFPSRPPRMTQGDEVTVGSYSDAICVLAVSPSGWDGKSCSYRVEGERNYEYAPSHLNDRTGETAVVVPDNYELPESVRNVWDVVGKNLLVTDLKWEDIPDDAWPRPWPQPQ